MSEQTKLIDSRNIASWWPNLIFKETKENGGLSHPLANFFKYQISLKHFLNQKIHRDKILPRRNNLITTVHLCVHYSIRSFTFHTLHMHVLSALYFRREEVSVKGSIHIPHREAKGYCEKLISCMPQQSWAKASENMQWNFSAQEPIANFRNSCQNGKFKRWIFTYILRFSLMVMISKKTSMTYFPFCPHNWVR